VSSNEFKLAQKYVIRFGKYEGQNLDKIAETDEGLKYLDWLNDQSWLKQPLETHLRNYMADPTIQKELEGLE